MMYNVNCCKGNSFLLTYQTDNFNENIDKTDKKQTVLTVMTEQPRTPKCLSNFHIFTVLCIKIQSKLVSLRPTNRSLKRKM